MASEESSKKKVVNKVLDQTKIEFLIRKGRIELTDVDDLDEYAPGSLISYIDNDDVLHKGGFLKKIKKDYVTVIREKDMKPIKVPFNNIKSMYVGRVTETTNDFVSSVSSDKKKTKFPVKIGDMVVYYAKNEFDRVRFKHTEKYKKIVQWHELFGDDEE